MSDVDKTRTQSPEARAHIVRHMVAAVVAEIRAASQEQIKQREIMTSSAAARVVGVSSQQIRVWASSGLLPMVRTTNGIGLFFSDDIEAFASKRRHGLLPRQMGPLRRRRLAPRRLRSIRRASNITQSELAARLGFSQGVISRIEHGYAGTAEQRRRIAEFLRTERKWRPYFGPTPAADAVDPHVDSTGKLTPRA